VPRPVRQETEAVNADSFLDIVASVVCIMLIMVLMVGMRIRNTPIDPALTPEAAQAGAAIEKVVSDERALRGDVTKVMHEIETLEQEAAARTVQRDMLATAVAAMEHDLGTRRSQMDVQTQTDFDAARTVGDARRQLDELRQRRTQAETARPEPIVVQSYPTPISRLVDNEEIHFHLRQGRVAFVPLEKLVRMARDDVRRKADKVVDHDDLREFTEAVGPVDGFRFRYTVERYEKVEERPGGMAVRQVGVQNTQWTIIPVTSQLGETIDDALAPNSAFRRVLAEYKADKTTITIWVYADSFDAFRRLRKELHQLGYGVAARPLPDGVMIAGSPKGSKSEAE
jgi:hypothetical protein